MVNLSTLEPEQKEALETQVAPVLQNARSMIVKNDSHRISAVAFVKGLKDLKTQIEERFHPTRNKTNAYKAYKDAHETEKAFYGPIEEAENIVKKSIGEFDREEAIKAQREAAAAEAKRQEAERKEREKLEAQARKAEEKGKVEKAEALREQAETVTAAPVFTPPANTKKLVWKARVKNPLQACKSVAEGILPWNVVEFKQSQLNAFAKNYDGKSEVPGIEFYQDVDTRIR